MDYKSHLEKAKQELASLTTQKAVLEEKVRGLVESLGLDASKPLEPQIEALHVELEQKKAQYVTELDNILKELEALDA